MKKPDNVSDNPGLLPYGSNVGAPAIQVSNIEHWKEPRVSDVNKQFQERFEGLKNDEIATELGISINTVKTQRQRAMKLMRLSLTSSTYSILGVILPILD